MSRNEQKRSGRSTVKTAIADLDRDALMALVRDLYDLSPGNKHFVHARLKLRQDTIGEYKKIVAECMCPDAARDVQIAKAKKAISDYRKAASDAVGEIDLMIHFVECGNEFTLEYGDINEGFYDSLLSMYARAVDAVGGLSGSERKPFRERLRQLTKSSDGIGWGYHDGLCDKYYSTFSDTDA